VTFRSIAEELTGGITGIVLSIGIYGPEIANHAINTIFVLVNTGLAVLISHKFKKWLDKRDEDQ
jgi:hypothetical protein